MVNFLSDFVSYFIPDLVLPDWLAAIFALVVITYFFKFILAILGIFNHARY